MRQDYPSLKEKLEAGQVIVGCLLAYDAPWLVELLALSGFDFVVIDLEHEVFDDSAVANLIRTADSLSDELDRAHAADVACAALPRRRRAGREDPRSARQGAR